MLSTFFGKTKNMDDSWQITFSCLHQDIGQEASDTRLGITLGRNRFNQFVNRLSRFDSIFDAHCHFLIDLIDSG